MALNKPNQELRRDLIAVAFDLEEAALEFSEWQNNAGIQSFWRP
jgi:hypothetical protein